MTCEACEWLANIGQDGEDRQIRQYRQVGRFALWAREIVEWDYGAIEYPFKEFCQREWAGETVVYRRESPDAGRSAPNVILFRPRSEISPP